MFIWLLFNLNHQLVCNAGVNMDFIMIMWACYTCANDLQHENNMQWLSRIVDLLQHYQILCIVTLYRCDQFSLCHSIHAPRAQWCHWKEIDDPGFVTEAAVRHCVTLFDVTVPLPSIYNLHASSSAVIFCGSLHKWGPTHYSWNTFKCTLIVFSSMYIAAYLPVLSKLF